MVTHIRAFGVFRQPFRSPSLASCFPWGNPCNCAHLYPFLSSWLSKYTRDASSENRPVTEPQPSWV